MGHLSRAVLIFIVLMPASLFGEPSVVADFTGRLNSGIPSGWLLEEKKGKADVRVLDEDGDKVVYMRSVKASFSLQKEMSLGLKDYPYLTWKWLALKLPERGDFRKGRTNDQALQTLIAFEDGKILSYIWDTTAPAGSSGDESVGWPVNLRIKVLVVKSGPSELGQWVTITRNVYEDYKRLFGEEPPPVKGVRVQINSQHTGTTAEGGFGRLVFKKAKD